MNSLEFKNWIVVCFIILAALLAAGLSIYQYLDGVKKETSKHNTTFQYSIISYDNENNMINHIFRIFEADNGMYTLLEQDDYNVDEEIFENAFFISEIFLF